MFTGVPHLEKPTVSVGNTGSPNSMYLYYPIHEEDVAIKASLLPACITPNKQQL